MSYHQTMPVFYRQTVQLNGYIYYHNPYRLTYPFDNKTQAYHKLIRLTIIFDDNLYQ